MILARRLKRKKSKEMKRKYWVYARDYFITEDPEDCRKGEWCWQGSTIAVSEKQAINNVKFRRMGRKSQYKPMATSGHWENGLEWKAIAK